MFLFSCSKSLDMQKTIFVGNFIIHVNINKMKYFKEHKSTFIYGNLNIQPRFDTFKFDTFDLNCVQIKINKSDSRILSVDSIASVLTQAFKTKKNIVDVDVYWVFNDNLEKNNINNFVFDLRNFHAKECVNISYDVRK